MTAQYHVVLFSSLVLVFCLESVEQSILEGSPPLSLNVDLTCGNVGEFTVVVTASTNGTSVDSTATRMFLCLVQTRRSSFNRPFVIGMAN